MQNDITNTLIDIKQFLTGTMDALNLMLEQQEAVLNQQKNNLDELLKQAMNLEKHNQQAKEQSKNDELSPAEIKSLQEML